MITKICPLCDSTDVKIFEEVKKRVFNKCSKCHLVFLSKEQLCDSESEKSRYLEHNNSVLSEGYKKFLYNLIDPIKQNQKLSDKGLDFGCGPYPMMSKLLRAEGYDVDDFDPYFSDMKIDYNKDRYKFIVLCEVIEHFSNPKLELGRIKDLLGDDGALYIQTSILSEDIDFKSWWYKDDITHVSFFSESTFEYICKFFNMKRVDSNHKNVIILKSEGSLK